jgi:hypothetical protein
MSNYQKDGHIVKKEKVKQYLKTSGILLTPSSPEMSTRTGEKSCTLECICKKENVKVFSLYPSEIGLVVQRDLEKMLFKYRMKRLGLTRDDKQMNS